MVGSRNDPGRRHRCHTRHRQLSAGLGMCIQRVPGPASHVAGHRLNLYSAVAGTVQCQKTSGPWRLEVPTASTCQHFRHRSRVRKFHVPVDIVHMANGGAHRGDGQRPVERRRRIAVFTGIGLDPRAGVGGTGAIAVPGTAEGCALGLGVIRARGIQRRPVTAAAYNRTVVDNGVIAVDIDRTRIGPLRAVREWSR